MSYADDVSISASVDRQEISLDDQLTLTITVNGNISNMPQPKIPVMNGFTAYSSGRSQNISIINGKVASTISFNYILMPNNEGTHTLGPFTIEYNGKTYSAGPIEVKVTPRGTVSQPAPSYGSPSQPQTYQEDSRRPAKELFIETYVDKLRAYVNEQIALTFAFYQSVDLFQNPVYNPPSVTGFWSEDMPPQKKYYKVINGTRYLVTEIKTALFATSPGEFTIGPARLEASVEDMEKIFSRSPFDVFDNMFNRGKPVILTTEIIKVEIVPLPEEGKPENFKGDVGNYNITAEVDKNSVEENQPVSLKVKIRGRGNIKTISSPQVPEMGDVKVYDSGSSENMSKADYIVQGEKTFEKVIIPKRPGTFTIGPVEYSYFDPGMRKYVEKKVEPINLTAIKSKEQLVPESTALFPGLTKEEIKLFKKDVAYIKTSTPSFKPQDSFFYKNKIFIALNIFPLVLLVFLYIYELHRERLRTDIGYARSRRAKRAATKRLKAARNILSKGDIKAFYAEIHRAAIEYVADKLNIPHASITKDVLESKLEEKGYSRENINRLKELFDVCDMARFASGKFNRGDMQRSLEEASEVITELEKRA
ncbi:MAG: BatD family protein [Candidatus Omnitrophica bacterium]|nr:BatD family protein [Candidatus Omnitrophota bacterium]MBU1933016.1 BatD family protein [Candidatus Omnitrophota bacterium]